MRQGSERDFTETQLATKRVYDGRLLQVFEDEVRCPDGKTARREYIRHPGAVIMMPLLDDDTVLLERQFRYPHRRHFYELPAGKIEHGEDPLVTARRELVEECGYEAANWEHLATLHPCIGYSDERIEMYLATGLTHVGHAHDEGEFLEVIPLRVSEAVHWIASGRITEVKAIIGLLWLDRFVRGRNCA
jgi:ADP-ribose pyrophosphatase